jgi:hypothetical protein
MIMKKHLILLLLALIGLGAFPAGICGQSGDREVLMARLERELELTDEVLRKAREVVVQSDNALVSANLSAAVKLQEWAWEQHAQLRRRFNVDLYRPALNATLTAREKATGALANFRQREQYEGIVLRDLERAKELLERAREAIAHTDNEGLRGLYASAENNLVQAWEFYRKGQLRPAFKLADQVKKAAKKLLKAANADLRAQGVYERRHQRVREHLDQVRQQVAGCTAGEAEALLQNAMNAFRRSEEAESQDRYGIALRQLQTARELAGRAARKCQGGESLAARYERLNAELDRLRGESEIPSGKDSEAVTAMLRQAEDQLTMARSLMDSHEFESATVSLKAAQLALRQAGRILEGIQ